MKSLIQVVLTRREWFWIAGLYESAIISPDWKIHDTNVSDIHEFNNTIWRGKQLSKWSSK